MTIGEKIRYFRTRIGITQAKLAELSGIHPVSIRKYETNKMIPQEQQIEKIANALMVSPFALTGIENSIRLETNGDFKGLLIMLCKNHIITIEGARGEDNALKPDTVAFTINPFITQFFNAKADKSEINPDKILYYLKFKDIFEDILKWEKANYLYEKNVDKYGNSSNKTEIAALENIKNTKEIIEMELQRSNIVVGKDGISVKIPPDYFN